MGINYAGELVVGEPDYSRAGVSTVHHGHIMYVSQHVKRTVANSTTLVP